MPILDSPVRASNHFRLESIVAAPLICSRPLSGFEEVTLQWTRGRPPSRQLNESRTISGREDLIDAPDRPRGFLPMETACCESYNPAL